MLRSVEATAADRAVTVLGSHGRDRPRMAVPVVHRASVSWSRQTSSGDSDVEAVANPVHVPPDEAHVAARAVRLRVMKWGKGTTHRSASIRDEPLRTVWSRVLELMALVAIAFVLVSACSSLHGP